MNAEIPDPEMYGAIEAGGTKFVVGIGPGPEDLRAWTSIPTRGPDETLSEVIDWLRSAEEEHGDVESIGIGSFGPLDLDPASPTYGSLTTTPKEGWEFVDLVERLTEAFPVPVVVDTDVNAAALGEHLYGAGRDADPLVYVTVGTGVGGGVIVHGEPLHGLVHPEIGHLQVPVPTGSRAVRPECQCRYHRACLEGFVSGPALAKRWGVASARDLADDSPAWEEAAGILAHGLVNLILTLSPRRIILGGGVMHRPGLIGVVREHVSAILNGYVKSPELAGEIDSYIVPPGLGDFSGLKGALAMAMLEVGGFGGGEESVDEEEED
jgi:fructokinase